ncbi:MAG TPA: FISUMP domain-containing protein [Thermodesulfobacteriota bacterium]|nr:FISUMP domain-containing protein [Thermodesulfobacteriota bacterium]
MRHFILLAILLLILISTAQKLPQLQLIGDPELATDELVGVRDVNGRECAAVQVLSDLSGLAYDAYNGVVRVDQQPGLDMVYLSPDERVLKILHTGHEPLKLILSEIGIHLKPRQVWRIRLTGEQKLTQVPIVVLSDPPGAEIYLDGESKGTGEQFHLNAGYHQVRLVKDGFQPIIERIQVDESHTLFRFSLEKEQDVLVKIDSKPISAEVFLGDVKLGETPVSQFFPAGRYRLRLVKEWYITYEDLIDVQSPEFIQTIDLQENYASLSVTSSPQPGMEIYLNGVTQNVQTPHTYDRLWPGTYQVRAKSAEYETNTETIELLRGDQKSIQLTSTANFAELTIRTHENAKVTLDGREIEQLQSVRLAPSVVVVRAELPKAEPVEERVVLHKGEKRTVELYPQVPTGTIQVAVVPYEAKAELIGDAGEYYTTVGGKSFSELPIGRYTLKVSLSGFADKQETLVLHEGEKLSRSVTLEKAIAARSTRKTIADQTTGTVTDIDGNVYQTVKIGNQVWMAENLKVTHYRNGDPIPNVTSDSKWRNLSAGARCNYDNIASNGETYGYLYNWYAVNDSRGLAPEGWHVPSDEDWKQLEQHLGMSRSKADGQYWRGRNEGARLKESGTRNWNHNPADQMNPTGFHARPGGYRLDTSGRYDLIHKRCYFWSSDEYDSMNGWQRALDCDRSDIYRHGSNKQNGFSVRCVRN